MTLQQPAHGQHLGARRCCSVPGPWPPAATAGAGASFMGLGGKGEDQGTTHPRACVAELGFSETVASLQKA